MKRRLALAALLGLILLGVIVSGYQAVADPTGAPAVGQVFRLESVRGMARDPSSGELKRATLTLTLTTTHVNDTRVRFTITGGQITIGDSIYTLSSGEGGAIVRKFGWVVLRGETTLASGEVFKFRLEGMLHIERAGLLVVGLAGGIGHEDNRIFLNFLARLSKA
jgi:hypothetical protein